ncbi:hypothetical protein ppKF707_2354 [Metapseudomonas furukawaii]|uniref:Uncharacterized protein n=1 Tax=Metapseudomonas furukawaii TaxID=1149133 RepID=A0AAD1FGU8_METFU|nr:hypothetical protein ppKF707_2354 [Pseudomonas furukawaii]BAU74833.1 hypothetical protein KF707C_31450 [Pseudomonas furukawaii]
MGRAQGRLRLGIRPGDTRWAAPDEDHDDGGQDACCYGVSAALVVRHAEGDHRNREVVRQQPIRFKTSARNLVKPIIRCYSYNQTLVFWHRAQRTIV